MGPRRAGFAASTSRCARIFTPMLAREKKKEGKGKEKRGGRKKGPHDSSPPFDLDKVAVNILEESPSREKKEKREEKKEKRGDVTEMRNPEPPRHSASISSTPTPILPSCAEGRGRRREAQKARLLPRLPRHLIKGDTFYNPRTTLSRKKKKEKRIKKEKRKKGKKGGGDEEHTASSSRTPSLSWLSRFHLSHTTIDQKKKRRNEK